MLQSEGEQLLDGSKAGGPVFEKQSERLFHLTKSWNMVRKRIYSRNPIFLFWSRHVPTVNLYLNSKPHASTTSKATRFVT
jgi:hypothetical protein